MQNHEVATTGGSIDDAVARINELLESGMGSALRSVGRYVAQEFLGGDASDARARLKGDERFRQLLLCTELDVAPNFLWYAVAIAEQAAELPDLVDRLPIAHQKILLPVKGHRMKRSLVERALEEGTSKRALARMVAEANRGPLAEEEPQRRGRGRPALPNFVKAARRATEVLQELKQGGLDSSNIGGARQLLGDLDNMRQAVQRLERDVQAAMAAQQRAVEPAWRGSTRMLEVDQAATPRGEIVATREH